MEFSKLYVVDSVFITVLKITKCKNTKRKRMTISFYLFFILSSSFYMGKRDESFLSLSFSFYYNSNIKVSFVFIFNSSALVVYKMNVYFSGWFYFILVEKIILVLLQRYCYGQGLFILFGFHPLYYKQIMFIIYFSCT